MGIFQSLTRGGQTNLHKIRMFNQVMRSGIAGALFIALAWFGFSMWRSVPSYAVNAYVKYWYSYLDYVMSVQRDPNLASKARGVLASSFHQRNKGFVERQIIKASYEASLAGMAGFAIILLFWVWYGGRVAGKHHERGARLVSSSQLRRLLKKRETYDISLSGIPFAKSFEPWHALLIGAPGTGKSSLMRDFLRQIRERGDRVVIVDTNGDYLTRFWREGDVLLNPSDARGENWSPWVEISNYSDAKQLAATLSPSLQFGNDPFWDKASQSILAASLFKLRETNEMRISHLYKLLMNASIADLENFLKDTKANAFMARDAEKMAASIRATLASHIESLDLLNDCPQEKAFSVKRWIQDETQGNWLFLSCSTGQRETHLPLLSTWFDLAMRSMMDLNPSDYRRIWFFCDELPTLGKIPFLIKGLAELRKYGGCVVAGLQNISQLEGIYGRSNTSAFSSLFGSKFCFKNPDPSTAKWAEDMLGKAEENKMNESLTYGANTVRDGVSLNAQERIRPVVLDAEIMNLKMLQAYVSYPQGYPIAKHEFAFKDVPATVPVFVKAARDFPEDENFSVDHHQLDDCKYA